MVGVCVRSRVGTVLSEVGQGGRVVVGLCDGGLGVEEEASVPDAFGDDDLGGVELVEFAAAVEETVEEVSFVHFLLEGTLQPASAMVRPFS